MKTLPIVRCTVSTDEKEVDVSRWIDEYDMLETLLSRDNTSGVLATVTFPVNFVSYAKDYVKNLFEKDGLYTKARFNVYLREDYGVNYNLVKSTALDFSTYKEETERVTVECAEEELSQLINSEGKTKYEVLVDEDIKSDKQWNYQRMELVNTGKFEIASDTPVTIEQQNMKNVSLQVALSGSEIIPYSREHDFKGSSAAVNRANEYIFKAVNEAVSINISANFSLICECTYIDTRSNIEDQYTNNMFVAILLYKEGDNYPDCIKISKIQLNMSSCVVTQVHNEYHYKCTYSGVFEYEGNLNIQVNNWINISVFSEYCYFQNMEYIIDNFSRLKIWYYSSSRNTMKINVIDPVKLMQKYLDNMSGNKGYFSVDIHWKEKDYKTMIVAAESIRQIPNAKIYGSPRDFLEWMKVLGYEYECIERKLIFKPRDEFFKKNVSAMGLRAHELADLIVQADQTYAYTTIEIGYDKQDYDSINGRCEANGTFCYTTGFIARKDNKLSLISPYRADSMGIEFLCQETSKDSTDTKSDKDVFFVALSDSGNFYTEYKGVEIVDSELGIRMFNAPFNPYFLIQRNESLIGINANQVKFKSTDMSGTAKLSDDTDIYKDQQITKKLFEPIEYNFAAGHWQKIPVPEKRNGLVYFEWQGKILKGFIKEIRKNYACETETTWILWAVK